MKEKKQRSKIYDSKIFWAVVSLLLSMIIWSYVSNIDGTYMDKTYSGIELQFSGETELLSQRGLTITNVSDLSVSVRLRGSRSNIGKLSPTELKAVIDVSHIGEPSDLSWSYDIVFPSYVDKSDVTIISYSPDTISFSVENYVSKTVSVKGSFEGSIEDGCVAEELVFEPAFITLEGPEKLVNTVDYAWVSFGSEQSINATYIEDCPYVLLDKDSQTVSADKLTVSTDLINATQPILKTKELPLTVNLLPGGGIKAEDCKLTIEPASITVAADSRLIDDKNSFILGNIDLASFEESFEQSFPIPIGEGVENITGVTDATVRVTIPDAKLRTVTTSNISCKNCSEGYTAIIDTSSVDVLLRSLDDVALQAVTPNDVTVVVDLADYGTTTGQIRAVAQVYVSGYDNVGAIGEIKVVLTIVRG